MRRRAWASDARHYQIVALTALLAFNMAWLDLGAKPLPSALAIIGALGTQTLCTYVWRLPGLDLRSPLITGLSLSLLLRADEPWVHAAAGVIAITAKFAFRVDGKHVWNPAGLAIVVLLFGSDHAWISPGQWGASVALAMVVVFLAILVLQASRRADIALFFLSAHAALLVGRAFWLGDPLAIPLHQLESGALLIFAFFMISDPKTAPDGRIARLLFAVTVALLAHYLAFFMQMRPALYAALIALSPVNPLLDRLFPAERFQWKQRHEGATP
jgi:enediyne biosynthesis protein E5